MLRPFVALGQPPQDKGYKGEDTRLIIGEDNILHEHVTMQLGTPKGRQLDPKAVADIEALLTDRPRRRDLLIEHLHLIQDKYGHISAAHLAALAAEMKLAQTEVYEVATFYAHFDVVKEGGTPPPPVTVRVCDSLSCALEGAEREAFITAYKARLNEAYPRRTSGKTLFPFQRLFAIAVR